MSKDTEERQFACLSVHGADKHGKNTSPRPHPALSMSPAPHSRAPPARAPRHIPKPQPTHTSPRHPRSPYGCMVLINTKEPLPVPIQLSECPLHPTPALLLLLLVLAPRHIPHPHQPTPPRPSCLSCLVVLVGLVAEIVPVVVGVVIMVGMAGLWGWSSRTFCVSASSNRQEQEHGHRHTGHCHSPFPNLWGP